MAWHDLGFHRRLPPCMVTRAARTGGPAAVERLRSRATEAGVLLAGLGLAACASRELPPWDLSQPGWTVREAPAAWRPRTGAPELLGELLVAAHPAGQRLIQFGLQGVPVVVARWGPAGWDIRSPLESRHHGGSGTPPSQVLWFQLEALPPRVPPPKGWFLETRRDHVWVLENRGTGERLEVAP